jgi:mono/diheme cytochrome c family protein
MERRTNMKSMNKVMRNIAFLIILLLVSFDVVAQEEHHHKIEPHRHLEYARIKNPVAIDAKSIAEGEKLYGKNCIACHGEAWKGGTGPNLTGSVRIHGGTDGEMFHVITDGVAGTAMKGFKKELTEEMRWHLVNYIKSLRNAKETK